MRFNLASPHKRSRIVFDKDSSSDMVVVPLKDISNSTPASPSKAMKNTDPSSPVKRVAKWGQSLSTKVRRPFSVKREQLAFDSEDGMLKEDETSVPSMENIQVNDNDSRAEDSEPTFSIDAADFDELSRAAKRRKSDGNEEENVDNTCSMATGTDVSDPAATPRLSVSHEIAFEMIKLKIDEENASPTAPLRRILSRKAGNESKPDAAVFDDLSTLGDSLKSAMFSDTVFSDVMFRCGPNLASTFLAHRVILAHRSEYFKSILSNAETTAYRKENLNLRYVIDKPNYNPDTFSRVLQYIYTGSVELRCDNVLDILQLSDDFRLNCLKKLCTKYLIQNTDTDNACNVLQTSRLFHAPELTRACLVFVEKRENVLAVLRSDGICDLSVENLVDLIKRDNLPLGTDEEIEIFDAVMRWNKHKTDLKANNGSTEEYDLNEIMKYIRFPLMNTEQLADIVEVSGMVSQNLLFEAYRHHVVPLNKLSQNKKIKAEKNMDEDGGLDKKERELKSKRFSTRIGFLQTTPRGTVITDPSN